MKHLVKLTAIAVASAWMMSSSALTVGTVDLEAVFQNSAQIKQINANLEQKFKDRQQGLISQGQSLQANMAKYNKNKAVMSKKDLTTLQNTISAQEMQLRNAQNAFQRDVYTARNKVMAGFLARLKSNIAVIAKQKKIDLVIPKNAVFYSNDSVTDVTNQVEGSFN